MMSFCVRALLFVSLLSGSGRLAAAADNKPTLDTIQTEKLLSGLRPIVSSLVGREKQFRLTGTVELPIDGKNQTIEINMARYNDESFDLALTHADYAVEIRRRADLTSLAVPRHGRVFVGRGNVAQEDRLSPKDLLQRLSSPGSKVAAQTTILNVLALGDLDATLKSLLPALKLTFNVEEKAWQVDNLLVKVPAANQLVVHVDQITVSLKAEPDPASNTNVAVSQMVVSAPKSTTGFGNTTTVPESLEEHPFNVVVTQKEPA